MMGFSISPYTALFAVFAMWSEHLQAYCVALACILLHELGHAVACDLLGFPPKEIRIHAFGASLQTDELLEENPRAEALVAAAGPAASLLLGGVSYILFCQLRWEIFYLFFVYHMIFGVFNLLPLPALDGGRLVFLFIEAIRGKRVAPDKEGWVHGIGMILLLALMAFVLFNDVKKIFF
jgi:Zn-dependent protease